MTRRESTAAPLPGDLTGDAPNPFRRDFPILEREVDGRPLVYLDNAATTQKPGVVIQAVERFYGEICANVHRGLHRLSTEATEAFEGARAKVARFVGAARTEEVVFTSGTTAAVNLVAHSFGSRFVRSGDEVLITEMEHHSNIIPWQLLCERSGARLRVVPIDDDGALRLDEFERLLGPRTRIVSVAHTSNSLGTRNPIERIVAMAHAAGAVVLVDAAQAMVHQRVDVGRLGCDLLALSGHKMFGPTGIGALYGRYDLLERLPPFLGGGEMIEVVRFERSTYKAPPHRFEAGTPNIAGAIGLGAAVDYLERAGLARIAHHDARLLAYATERLLEIPGLRLIGTAADKTSILSFNLPRIHSHDVGQWLDGDGIAVRAGHHCAQPVMRHFGVPSTVRASLVCYNTRDEVDALVRGLVKTLEVMGR
ncbi:MAG TPA: cysteine desulfurase [Candidatus Polarisedimenticolaceae bacterium]|nr:cysteine desulfurase [Candidatus Polarisedimenticolaceae bacterium]